MADLIDFDGKKIIALPCDCPDEPWVGAYFYNTNLHKTFCFDGEVWFDVSKGGELPKLLAQRKAAKVFAELGT